MVRATVKQNLQKETKQLLKSKLKVVTIDKEYLLEF